MHTLLLLATLGQLLPPPGAVVVLRDWEGRPQVAVTVEGTSPQPVDWTDGAGTVHHAVTITYRDPKKGRMTTTLAWFGRHVVPVYVPVGPPRPIYDLPLGGHPPPKPPASNQEIRDGIARPSDVLYSRPATRYRY
jgi:hypothetical protein